MNINRIIWIVLDSVGIGEARDAAKFVLQGVWPMASIARE